MKAPRRSTDPFAIPFSERTVAEQEIVSLARRQEYLEMRENHRRLAMHRERELDAILTEIDDASANAETAMLNAVSSNIGGVEGVHRMNERLRLTGLEEAMINEANVPYLNYGHLLLCIQVFWGQVESMRIPEYWKNEIFSRFLDKTIHPNKPGTPRQPPARPNPEHPRRGPTPMPESRLAKIARETPPRRGLSGPTPARLLALPGLTDG